MMVVWLVVAIGLLLAGLVAIAFGFQINEFSLGNPLIVAGTVASCTGILLLGLRAAIGELKEIARRLGPGAATESFADTLARAPAGATSRAAQNGGIFGSEQPGSDNAGDMEPAAAPSQPWHGEPVPSRDRATGENPFESGAEPEPPVKQRRNLLFSSSSRKERERTQARSDESMTDSHPESAAPPPVPEAAEAPPASFEDAWPKPERSRPDVPPRRAGRTPSTFTEAGPGAARPDYPSAGRHEEPAQVTVLKSGVVDGMAYSLYSDGSIEAQMPEGMMRFASIDELRTHLDQRS